MREGGGGVSRDGGRYGVARLGGSEVWCSEAGGGLACLYWRWCGGPPVAGEVATVPRHTGAPVACGRRPALLTPGSTGFTHTGFQIPFVLNLCQAMITTLYLGKER